MSRLVAAPFPPGFELRRHTRTHMAERVDWSCVDARAGELSRQQLVAYLRRCGLNAAEALLLPPGLELLNRVVVGHAVSIPFEMYDVTTRTPVSLALGDVVDKLVVRRRGGYCLESNGLCAAALASLGYSPVMRHARVWLRATEYTPENPPIARQHQVLVVQLADGREYMVDVGFGGGSPAVAVPLVEREFDALGERYRMQAGVGDEDTWIVWGWRDGAWRRLFSFEHVSMTCPKVHAADFIMCSHFVQVANGTLFKTCRYSTRSAAAPGGRVTIMRHELKKVGPLLPGADAPTIEVTRLETADALAAALREHMGIVLTAEEARLVWAADAPEEAPGEDTECT
jgi:arylamine N-acetyltransferase